MELSVIIPAHNEEKRILPTLEEHYSFLTEHLKEEFEIIIVTNLCRDRTLEIVRQFAEKKKNIIIHNIPDQNGKGRAVFTGFDLAKGNIVGFTDADNSVIVQNFFKLYCFLKENQSYEGVIASRKIKGALIDPPRKLSQGISSFLFTFFAKLLFRLKYKDTQCGAKLFRKDVAKFLADNYHETGWAFDVEMLYRCKKQKYLIKEFPIVWKDCANSKVTFFGGVNSFIKLFSYRLREINHSLSGRELSEERSSKNY